MTRFKVCCIQDEDEVAAAVAAGAALVGLVADMPSGPGPVPDRRIAELVAATPAGVTPVLLTARSEPDGIVDHLRATVAPAVQLVRHLDASVRHAVRRALPRVGILQVVHVEDASSVARARGLAEGADILLLDSGRPSAEVAEFGGTGRTHDWSLSAAIVREASLPVLLAGGLGPHNVAEAVRTVGPWGVDVCSGLRGQDGRLVPDRLRAFARALG